MPSKPLAYCSSPGCCERVRSGRCAAHSRQIERERGSASSRGYDRPWRRFRLRVLNERPCCEDCLDAGVVTLSRELHHIVALRRGGARLDARNVMALCTPHHATRTRRGE